MDTPALITASQKDETAFFIGEWSETPLRPVVNLHRTDTTEGWGKPLRRYARAEIALPANDGFNFPLVLNIQHPQVARALSEYLATIADQLDEPFVDDEFDY